jgi:hypothetical protein
VIVLVTGLQGSGKSTVAEECAELLAAPVIGWDWMMAALVPFEPVREALTALDRDTYRAVGWAMLWQAARAQSRGGRSVVLDGMARDLEVAEVRKLAAEENTSCLVVLTRCDDVDIQRSRIEGRRRDIPGWHELTWDHVAKARRQWVPPTDVDLMLDTTEKLEATITAVAVAIDRAHGSRK